MTQSTSTRSASTPAAPATAEGAPPAVVRAGPDRRAPLWRRALRRVTASESDLAAEDARRDAVAHGGVPCGQVADRRRACVCGTLRSVTSRPRGGVPAVEAELFDGTGAISLVWLGRRRIPGVEPGRRVRAKGLVASDGGQRVIFNPGYELLPVETA